MRTKTTNEKEMAWKKPFRKKSNSKNRKKQSKLK